MSSPFLCFFINFFNNFCSTRRFFLSAPAIRPPAPSPTVGRDAHIAPRIPHRLSCNAVGRGALTPPQRLYRCGLHQNRSCQQQRARVSPPYAKRIALAPNLQLCVGRDAHSAAVGDEGALRMRHTPCGCIAPRIPHQPPFNAVGAVIDRPFPRAAASLAPSGRELARGTRD